MTHPSNVVFVDTSVIMLKLKDGKSFEAVAAGDFIDMYGRPVKIKPEDLGKIVENTKAAIEATRTESGELVGLPIDARNHENGDGAGWIVDVFLEDERVKVVPKWTEIGIQLIEDGIRRFFSGSIDLVNKVLLGGTLTNWPATRTKGITLLKPIEMSLGDGVSALEMSLEEELKELYTAFSDSFMYEAWGVEAHDDYLVAQTEDGKYFRVPYKRRKKGSGYDFEFTAREEWKEVRHTWIDATLNRAKEAVLNMVGKAGSEPDPEEKENDMPKFKLEDLSEEERAAVMSDVITQMQKADGLPADVQARLSAAFQNVALKDVFNLEEASKELASQMKEALMAEYKQLQEESSKNVALLIADIRRKDKVANLSRSLTDGKASEAARGLPISMNRLQEFLLGLSPAQQSTAEEIFLSIVRDGLVNFKESGRDGEGEAKIELPAEIVSALKEGSLKVDDLGQETLGLGDLSRYDLTAFVGKE